MILCIFEYMHSRIFEKLDIQRNHQNMFNRVQGESPPAWKQEASTAACPVHGLSCLGGGGGGVVQSPLGLGYSPSQGVFQSGEPPQLGQGYPSLERIQDQRLGMELGPETGVPPEGTWDQRMGRNMGPDTGVHPCGQTHTFENTIFPHPSDAVGNKAFFTV